MRLVEVGRTTNAAAANNSRIKGPASCTRGRKKRQLRPFQDVSVAVAVACVSPISQQSQDLDSNGVEDGEDQVDDKHQATNSDQPSRIPDAPWIPGKMRT